jgi:DNA-binding NtrC family response regulator
LHVIEGPDAGKSFVSKTPRASVGTAEAADFALTDTTVSRFHLQIEIHDGRARCRDGGSLNGTWIDGVSVLDAFLEPRATLALGETRLRFDIGSDHVKVPLSKNTEFGSMVGASPAMRGLFATLESAAETDATVLILGETGTGKGLAAESIHDEGARRGGPFVVVQCGSLPRELLESELFGHEKGAFTGAVGEREGAFESANGGTLFLDELGEMSPDLQPKLLHALEKREIKRVGSNHYRPIDVRLIAATNRDLRTEVNGGGFRSDLYYRLAVVEVTMPSLRDRPEDLPLLVETILARTHVREGEDPSWLQTDDFQRELARHTWPGNIRELRNYLERCLALRRAVPLAETGVPEASDTLVDANRPLREAREQWQTECERRYLEAVLARHDGNVSAAARFAKVDRSNFYRLLWRHGLK